MLKRQSVLKIFKSEGFFIAVLAAASVYLLFMNLGNRYLWQDEARSALISGTILHAGIPLGHDGKNSFSQDKGAEFKGEGDYTWRWHPWLPFTDRNEEKVVIFERTGYEK